MEKKDYDERITILIVDDDPDICTLLEQVIEDPSRRLLKSYDGQQAIEMVRDKKVDLIISDLNMPYCDGIELLKQVKDTNSEIVVILMTGFASLETFQTAISLGVSDYITKPIRDLDFLKNTVERGIERTILLKERQQLLEDLKNSKSLLEIRVKERTQKLESSIRQLKETQAKLLQSEKLAAIGRLSAGIGHELNNPLSGILGFSKLLKRKKGHDAETINYLDKIYQQGKRCQSIVENLLKFSQQYSPRMTRIDTSQTFKKLILLPRLERLQGQIEFKKEIFPHLPSLNADIQCLENLFTNLLANAMEAVDFQGKIMVKVSKGDEDTGNDIAEGDRFSPFEPIKKEDLGRYLLISIVDNGCGIDVEDMNNLFEPFFTTKEGGESTGLGLSICYGIINEHGGSMEICSKLGLGTRVKVYLPFCPLED